MLASIIERNGQALNTFFSESEIERVARDCRFVQRSSKLTASITLKTLVLGFIQHPRASLNQLCQVCLDYGVLITPQGLDQRINGAAEAFVRQMLQRALIILRAKRQEVSEVLDQFSAVYFQDSTITSLPEALQAVFPGAGGNASSAAVKIQLLFEFLRGNIDHLAFMPSRKTDQGYQGHVSKILPGSLLIQDLGFFNLKTLQTMVAQAAFFLTRWKNDVRVFLAYDLHTPVDMLLLLRQQATQVAQHEVLLGARARLPCRMVCVHLPTTVAAERRRRVRANAKRRGTTLSQHSLDLCDWNVFVTNVPVERLSLHQILVCYSLRWQVELIFKLWKSEAALRHLAGIRKERVLCELYAKMIGIVLSHFLVAPLRFLLREQQIEISAHKARQVLQNRVQHLALSIDTSSRHLKHQLLTLCLRILLFARKTKRKKRLSTFDKLLAADDLAICQLYPLA